MIELSKACLECENKCSIFRLLTEFELELIEKNRYEVKFKPGEVILKQGTAFTHVVAHMDGLAKIYIEGYHGKDLLLKIQKPKGIVAGPGMYLDNRHHFSFSALTNCVACLIDINVFKEVIRSNPVFMEAFMTEYNLRSVNFFQTMISLTQKQMHGRIADALIYLSDQVFCSSKYDMIISRQELADMTAMTKESASRIIQQFKNEGIITLQGNCLEILNQEQLRNISITG